MGSAKSIRLYMKGKIVGYRRSKVNLDSQTSLIKIEGVESRKETLFYSGKRVAFVYSSNSLKQGTKFRCIWGKIIRAHGTAGVVRAKFQTNLPPNCRGANCRIMLFPSQIYLFFAFP